MDKLAAIRIYDGQNYSDEIPITTLAENVQWNQSSTLVDILGSIDLTRKGNIQDQIDELNNRTYSKPINGIPKTDLASSVQVSLGKADTALQSYTETDPTVSAWAKQPNKPTYTAQEVGALPIDAQITIEVDNTLSIQGAATDAKKVGDELVQIEQDLENQQTRAETAQALKINKPVTNPNGTQGQILQTDGQGGTTWVDKQTDEQIANTVTNWLDDHVAPGSSTIIVDNTLNIQGAAADAKKTGDEIADLKEELGDLSDLDTAVKTDLVSAINETLENAGSDVSVINGKLIIDGVEYGITSEDAVGISNIAKTGTSGLVDTYTITMTDGTTYIFTVTNGNASDAKIQAFIEDWLDEHPEATTTVQDEAITMAKLSFDVKSQLGTRANHNYKYNDTLPEGTSTFIELFQKVKKEVMNEYRGNMDKIPFILVTDPHGQLAGRKGIFDAINSCVNWYDISKFFNLGDVVTSTYGSYTSSTDELTTCSQLETMISVLSPIPMDKQVNVFGNHDSWCLKSGEAGYKMLPQNLLAPYFRNAQGHRMNNAGYFALKDDYFNVKYVVVSGFEYIGGVGVNIGNESASTEQISWLVKELGKDDGYDIVIVCHEPLFPDWAGRSFESRYPRPATSFKTGTVNNTNRWAWLYTDDIFLARKNKTTGSFTDRSGVVHTFDYSGLTGNLLCGLDGHLHFDCSQYTGNDEFLCESFGSFKPDQGGFLYFGLIDRENNLLNIWKIIYEDLVYENYQVPFSIPETAGTYTIKRRLKNTEMYQISNTIREGQTFFDIVFPKSGYTVGTVKVLMGGIDVTSTYYDSTTHEIRIPSVTGDIDITAYDSTTSADALVWTITNNFENASSNKPKVYGDEYYENPICVSDGSSFSETIDNTASHNIYDISVTMGNIDITSSLTSTRGTVNLSIANVSGDINVICKACEISHVQGLLTNTGDVDASQTSWVTTSFVPIDGSTVGSITCDSDSVANATYIAFYDENHRFINRVYSATRSSVIYVASNARYVRVSMAPVSEPGFFALPNKTITNASVTVTPIDITLGEYPSTIKRGDRLTIPYTKDVDGIVVVDSCTAGGSNIACTVTEDSIVIPYTPGDVVVVAHVKTRILYELENELTLTNSTQSIDVRPMASVDDSFTIMLDYTLTEATANGTYIFRNGSSSGGVYIDRQLSNVNTVRVCYAGVTHIPTATELTVAKGTRCKIVATHVGGSNSYDTKWYFKTAAINTPLEHTTTNAGGSAGSRRVYDGPIVLGSSVSVPGTVTYHNLKVLSEVATEQEINDFLASD